MNKRLMIFGFVALALVSCVTVTFAQVTYQVRINSNVKGAYIYVDGVFKGNAPLTIQVAPGRHTFKLTFEGYKDAETTLTITNNTTTTIELEKIEITPSAQNYNLRINSNVRGASIFIDDILQEEVTPATIVVGKGTHRIKVTAAGYRDYITTISISADTTTTVELVKILNSYNLRITATAKNSRVFINNDDKGYAPITTRLAEGTYTVVVKSSGYLDFTITVQLSRDTSINANMQLAKKIYTLTVTSNVKDSRVSINGAEERDRAPLSIKLEEGRYLIRVTATGYIPYELTIQLDRDLKIDALLTPPRPTLRIIIPKEIQNPDKNKPENRVDVYLDGRKQKDLEFNVNRGWHRIRIETGALVWEKDMNFKDGVFYIIQVFFDMEIIEEE